MNFQQFIIIAFLKISSKCQLVTTGHNKDTDKGVIILQHLVRKLEKKIQKPSIKIKNLKISPREPEVVKIFASRVIFRETSS